MSLESQLVAHLGAHKDVAGRLAQWKPNPDGPTHPAIFLEPEPADGDAGWVNGKAYPRIRFKSDWFITADKLFHGTVHLWTLSSPVDESAGELQRAVYDAVFLMPLGAYFGIVDFVFHEWVSPDMERRE